MRIAARPTARVLVALALAGSLFSVRASAQHAAPHADEHGAPAHGAEHGAAPHDAEHAEHGAAHGEHDGPPGDMNLFHGVLGEKEGVEPDFLWRAPGTPPPFIASLINFGLLIAIIVRFGAQPLAAALRTRRDTIMRDIDEASKMRAASEARLTEYEQKLAEIEQELERVRNDFREQGERERERIIKDANERRERMKKDAEFLLAQELKQMRLDLLRETVDAAIKNSTELLSKKLTAADHERFAEAFLNDISGGRPSLPPPAAAGGLS